MSLILKYTTTDPSAIKPKRKNDMCVGYDLYSTKTILAPPRDVVKIDTGIILEMQGQYYGKIVARPNETNFIEVAGVIDPSYRGSIIVCLFNMTDKKITILPEQLIAQLLFIPVLLPELIHIDAMEENTESSLKTYIKYTKTNPSAFTPTRFEEGSVGYDLHALKNASVPPFGSVKIDTGIVLHMQGQFYGQIQDKSGFSTKRKLHVKNGVVDSSHKSSIVVHFQNLSDQEQHIFAEEKIAQIIFIPVCLPKLKHADEIDLNTTRGMRGFSSGGVCNITFNSKFSVNRK